MQQPSPFFILESFQLCGHLRLGSGGIAIQHGRIGARLYACGMQLSGIDCHAHILSKDLPITSDRHTPPDRDYTLEELISTFDSHGISHGVLTAPSYYLTNNTLLLESMRAARGRLRATVTLDPAATAEQLEQLTHLGVCGMRLNWWRKKTLPDIHAYVDLMCKMRDVGWHLELFLDGVHMPAVLPVIGSTGVKLVLDHFGCPEAAQGTRSAGFHQMLSAMDTGRTWVKLSAPYRLAGGDPVVYAQALLKSSGPERLVWGSDWPWGGFEVGMTFQRCLDWLSDWIPDARQRRTVFLDTPRELFGF